MCDNPIILNLHLLLWDSYIAIHDVRPPFAAEGRRNGCGYPPSFARSQNIGNGILGVTKDKESIPQGYSLMLTWDNDCNRDRLNA